VPLTTDEKLFAMYLDALSTSLLPGRAKDTTQVLDAMAEFLKGENVPGTVLFVTDGIEPQARSALDRFLKAGTNSVLVLGVGTSRGAPIRGAHNEFVEDANGRRLFSKLDVDALKSLNQLGVSATTVTLDDSDVQWIQRKVQSHLTSAQEQNVQTRWVNEGYWFVLPIAALAALWFRRGWTVQWSRGALALLFLFPHTTREDVRHRFLSLWMTADQQGRYYFERGAYEVAAARFENPAWKGVANARAGDYASALDQFALSDTAEAWYNQGNALAHLHKFSQAVHAYEQALQRKPGWRDAQDNLNLVRSLIPPPKKDDDQQVAPTAERGETEMEEEGKGKKGTQRLAMDPEKMADIWMRNIQTSPADFLRRRFEIEDNGDGRP
jgi:Ca-activated chloride channel family protein